jgi:hypothetical protein
MRVRVLTLSLALVIGAHAIGCKSAPKLPWFSSANTATAGASAATTASAAPQLPSEIAKQSEGLTGADPVKITMAPAATMAKTAGGAAPGYIATPNTYPSTGAQDYLSNSAAAMNTASGATAANVAGGAKSSLPYDPTAVPPTSIATASTPANSAVATADRYGMSSQERYGNTYPASTPAYTPGSFPTSSTPNTTQATTATSAASSVAFASSPGTPSTGDRYATGGAPPASPVSSTVPSYSAPVQPASAVASLQPYRPGGTSSYPGTSANYEVATRPGSTSTSTATSSTSYR